MVGGKQLRALFLNGRIGAAVRTVPDENDPVAYVPPASTIDATLWLRRWHPERLEAWLNRHDPRLRKWLKKQRAPLG